VNQCEQVQTEFPPLCILKMPRAGNALNDCNEHGGGAGNCMTESECWGKSAKLPAQLTGRAWQHSPWIQAQNWCSLSHWNWTVDEDRLYNDNPLQWLLEVNHPLWVGPTFLEGRLTLPIKCGLAKATQCMSSYLCSIDSYHQKLTVTAPLHLQLNHLIIFWILAW
jgi:hypothetical protein